MNVSTCMNYFKGKSRILFFLAFIANVALTLLSLAMLPAKVACHFGINGVADGWMDNYVNCIIMTGLLIFMFCVFYFLPRLIFLFPPGMVNLHNKEYWLRPGMKTLTIKKIQSFMCGFGVALFLLLFTAGLLTLQANLSKPVKLNIYVFYAALSIFSVYLAGWTIMLFRAFRIPRDEQHQ